MTFLISDFLQPNLLQAAKQIIRRELTWSLCKTPQETLLSSFVIRATETMVCWLFVWETERKKLCFLLSSIINTGYVTLLQRFHLPSNLYSIFTDLSSSLGHTLCMWFYILWFPVTLTVLTALVSLLVLIYIHFTLTDRHCSLCRRMAAPHCLPPSLENSRVSLFTLQPPPLCLQYCDSIFSVEYSIRHFKNLWIKNFWKQQFSLNAFLRRHYHLPVCLLLKLCLSHTHTCVYNTSKYSFLIEIIL